jgi:K+-transporting ATPase KdpF subunit
MRKAAQEMSATTAIILVVTVLVFVYLVYAMLRPEKF